MFLLRSKHLQCGPLEFRINALGILIVLALCFVLLRLGLWQLSRAEEKVQQQQSFLAEASAAPTPIATVPLAGREYDSLQIQNRQVVMEGHYLNEKSIFMVYQPFEDQIGYEVVVPFVSDSSNEIVMVSRGWTGAASYEALRENLPPVEGKRSVQGQIYVVPESAAHRSNNITDPEWPLMVRFLNMEELAPYFELPVFPYVVRLNEGEEGVLVRHWSTVIVDTSRNYSYALQWFSMAIAVVIAGLILSSNLLQLIHRKYGKP